MLFAEEKNENKKAHIYTESLARIGRKLFFCSLFFLLLDATVRVSRATITQGKNYWEKSW
jgi:hypothetical protein